jgi:cell division protein FtsB
MFAALIVVAVYLLAVTPVRTYFQQRTQMQEAQQRYEVLRKTNEQLQLRANELQSDAEIKRLARERYELVEPGQQVYAVMPPAPVTTPDTTPPEPEESMSSRVWDAVNPWN